MSRVQVLLPLFLFIFQPVNTPSNPSERELRPLCPCFFVYKTFQKRCQTRSKAARCHLFPEPSAPDHIKNSRGFKSFCPCFFLFSSLSIRRQTRQSESYVLSAPALFIFQPVIYSEQFYTLGSFFHNFSCATPLIFIQHLVIKALTRICVRGLICRTFERRHQT